MVDVAESHRVEHPATTITMTAAASTAVEERSRGRDVAAAGRRTQRAAAYPSLPPSLPHPYLCPHPPGNRSRDITSRVTAADLNNIRSNRFRSEFHYFSRFHGNSCPVGKYISPSPPSSSPVYPRAATDPSLSLSLTLSLSFSSVFLATRAPLFLRTFLSLSPSLSRFLRAPSRPAVRGTSDFYRFAPFMFIRWNKALQWAPCSP